MSEAPRRTLDNLLRYVSALPAEKAGTLLLEDVALCAAWYESYRDTPERQESFASVPEVIKRWLAENEPVELKTEGRRQQPLLRLLIKDVAQGRIEELTRDAVDFLCIAWDLISRSAQASAFNRPAQLLKAHAAALRARRQSLEGMPGVPSLIERVGIYTAGDLRQGEVRDVKTFAGINVPFRGPVVTHRGDARVLEGIPGNCSMVVEEGSCWVNGSVLGNLAATEACEVRENISGAVIARRGDIRADTLLNPAVVISKEGSVFCRSAQDPRMVYGCQAVRVATSVKSGVYLGRRVEVAEEVMGGEIQVSEIAQAAIFRQAPGRTLSIVLRRGLNCQDYGEVLPQEALKMLSNATRLCQRLTNIQRLQEVTAREADEYAGSVLLFLLGEDDTPTQMHRIRKLRRRLAFMDRLILGARGLIYAVENRMNALPGGETGTADSYATSTGCDERELLGDLQQELMVLAAEGTIDRDLFDYRETVLALGRKLQRASLTRHETLDVLRELTAVMDDLGFRREEMAEVVEKRENSLQQAIGRAAILERAKANRSRVEVLKQLLSAGRERESREAFQKRSNDRFVRLMQRNIENRLSRLMEYRASVQEIKSRVQKTRTKLWEVHMVSLPESILTDWMAGGARAEGRFEEGVRLCAWRHLLEPQRGSVAGLLETPDSGGETVIYTRTSRGTIERA